MDGDDLGGLDTATAGPDAGRHGPVEMTATCWTSAGDVRPDADPGVSPIPIADRVDAVAVAGFAGLGIVAADLAEIKSDIGLPALGRMLDESGLKYVEIELLERWWVPEGHAGNTFHTRRLLLEAADVLGPTHIKIGSENATPRTLEPYTEALLELTESAVAHGTRIAIEPMPFSIVPTIPAGAELARSTGHPDCGVIVDAWHVFRTGTSLSELRDALTADVVFGVELDDADEVVRGTLFSDTITNRRLCGQGSFDLAGLIAVLREIGYRGTWGVEILSDVFRRTPLDVALAQAIETARSVLDPPFSASRREFGSAQRGHPYGSVSSVHPGSQRSPS